MADDQSLRAPLELWQFRLSLYPEKARWALDYKGLPHIRHSLLPGPHVLPMLLRAGQKSLPVLRHGPTQVRGSAAVIDYLERQFPQNPLYPHSEADRARALELQAWFDERGAQLRRAFFHDFLADTRYAADCFSLGYTEGTRRWYATAFPLIRAVMKLDMRISAAGAEEGRRRTKEALDFVAREAGPQGYLVGERFSIADLTAAVVLSATALPEAYPVTFAQPHPPGLARWLARWADHPGTAWVREIYRRHRGRSSATADCNG